MSLFHPTPFHREPTPSYRHLLRQHLPYVFSEHIPPLLEPLAVIYLLYLSLDIVHQLLTKRTTLGALLRWHSPGLAWLAVGAGAYAALIGIENVQGVGARATVLEAAKVVMLAWILKGVARRVRRWWSKGFQGTGRKVAGSAEVETNHNPEEMRRLREERVRVLEAKARRGMKMGNGAALNRDGVGLRVSE
jgi:hypothetical protein